MDRPPTGPNYTVVKWKEYSENDNTTTVGSHDHRDRTFIQKPLRSMGKGRENYWKLDPTGGLYNHDEPGSNNTQNQDAPTPLGWPHTHQTGTRQHFVPNIESPVTNEG